MILDSSAIIAVITQEPGYESVLNALSAADQLAVGAPTIVETGIVLSARGGIAGKTLLARFIQEAQIITVPFTGQHWSISVDAYLRFGKGQHPASLNFGDCLTYAVAKLADQPLLCLGLDFAQTDLELVLSAEQN